MAHRGIPPPATGLSTTRCLYFLPVVSSNGAKESEQMAANNGALKFKFNPMQDGITTVLGPLESQIMAVAWEMQQATASDVHHTLQINRQRENRDIAYTTVMTTMSRLYDKNILHRRKVGMSFVYTPALGQEEFVALVVKNVLDSLVG